MALNTKLELYDGKVFQGDGHTLTLSGDTVIATSGDLRYQTHPTFTGATQIVDKCYVDSATGSLGANNGLTRSGNNITLGGALTGATTITAGAGTSLLFTDSRTPSIGIQYGGDYSAGYTQRSIVDAAYVTGKTSQAILTAINGLTKTGTAVKFGGTLCEITRIDQAGFNLNLLNGRVVASGATSQGFDSYVDYKISGFTFVNSRGPSHLNVGVGRSANYSVTTGSFNSAVGRGALYCNLTGNSNTAMGYSALCKTNAVDNSAFGNLALNGNTIGIQNTAIGSYSIPQTTTTGCGNTAIGYRTLNNLISGCGNVAIGICAGYNETGSNKLYIANSNTTQPLIYGDFATKCAIVHGVFKTSGATSLLVTPSAGALTDAVLVRDSAGLIKTLSVATITGATAISAANGITKTGNLIELGGALTKDTSLTGGNTVNMELGTSTSPLYTLLTVANSDIALMMSDDSATVAMYSGSVNISGDECITLNSASISIMTPSETASIRLTGSTINLKGVVSLKTQPSSTLGDILTINPTTGLIGKTVLSSLGGLTGATNGIGKTGQNVCLGGALVAATTFTGAHAMNFCNTGGLLIRNTSDIVVDGQSNAGLILKSQAGTCATSADFTNAIGINIDFNGTSGFNIVDNRAGAAATGIVYNADYSLNYTVRSLVDKGYVDTIATGLQVHEAVKVGTTGEITLSNSQEIDGVVVSNPDRVLVKDQTTGTQNGIYVVVDAGAWTRATDFDNSLGEITNGDLIPITSGLTQNNQLWALTTKNPIILDTTALVFTKFSTIIDIQAGNGMAITQVGGQHTACILLGDGVGSTASCGLSLSTNGLCVSSSIAGCGLTYTDGALCVNAVTDGAIEAIPVRFNDNCCLVVNCVDINAAINAGNGLTNDGSTIVLGGNLTGTTLIDICGNTLNIAGAPGEYFMTMDDTNESATTLYMGSNGCTTIEGRGLGSSLNISAGGSLSIQFAGNGIITDNSASGLGLQYAAPYEGTFIDASLVSKCYVDSLVATSGVTASNGLTVFGQEVQLGGILTGDTNIIFDTQSFTVTDLDGKNYLTVSSGYVEMFTDDTTQYSGIASTPTDISIYQEICGGNIGNICITDGIISMRSSTGGDLSSILVDFSGITINGTYASFAGAQYLNDYSENFTERSLVDKAYVDSSTGAINADNGLTRVGDNIELGGALTGDTTIDTNSSCLFVCNSIGNPLLTVDDNHGVILQGNVAATSCISVIADGKSSGIKMCSPNIEMSASSVSIYGSTQLYLDSPSVYLNTAPPTGTISDSVLVRDSIDGIIKTVSGAALGDKNNIYARTTVTTSTVLTSGSTYVIFVNNSAAVTITLPATPLDGQVFKIKNVSGASLSNPITVAGNTRNIDGSPNALINTDFGALELIYDTTLNAWFSLAFIN